MNKNMQDLLRLIVPAVLLIIWALSNLFNRERNAAQARGTPALGPRPGYPPLDRNRDRERQQERERDRNRDLASMNAMRPGSASGDPDMLIIRDEAVRTSAPPRPLNGPGNRSSNPPRRSNRNRPPQPGGARRPETADRPRREELHDAKISANVNQSIARSIQLRPLTENSGSGASAEPVGPAATMVEKSQSAMLVDVRATLNSPGRIREAFVLNEILQPPVSRRKPEARRQGPPPQAS